MPVPACHVLIPSAGSGSRSGLDRPKQYQPMAGQRVIDHTLRAFAAVPAVHDIHVVVAPGDDTLGALQAVQGKPCHVWPVGGSSRAHSVFNGLLAMRHAGVPADDWVLVHDAARCLITPALVERLIDAVTQATRVARLPGATASQQSTTGGLLAVPLPDTLKAADGTDRVDHTVDRSGKWLAQTPQMFTLQSLLEALAAAAPGGFAGITDEASAIEALGGRPLLVRGSVRNLKVTYPEDFSIAQALLAAERQP